MPSSWLSTAQHAQCHVRRRHLATFFAKHSSHQIPLLRMRSLRVGKGAFTFARALMHASCLPCLALADWTMPSVCARPACEGQVQNIKGCNICTLSSQHRHMDRLKPLPLQLLHRFMPEPPHTRHAPGLLVLPTKSLFWPAPSDAPSACMHENSRLMEIDALVVHQGSASCRKAAHLLAPAPATCKAPRAAHAPAQRAHLRLPLHMHRRA